MAADSSWPSIQLHGLLSTRALVDLYNPGKELRDSILNGVRRTSYILSADGMQDAVVRDQKPLKFLDECLNPGVTQQEFLDALNERVFFHVNRERLERLLGARAYRKQPQQVLVIDTESFLSIHGQVDLAPYNTGSVHLPTMPKRGPDIFIPLEKYDWNAWRAKRGIHDAVVELTTLGRADIAGSVLEVESWHEGKIQSHY